MSEGRLTFKLGDNEQMKKLRDYLGGEYVRREGKRVAKDEEHSSSDRDMRDTSEAV
jgi:hypothetical protein